MPGPLGNDMDRALDLPGRECASVTFDSAGRIVTVCVGLEGPRLVMFDPQTLDLLAEMPLPPRKRQRGGNPFTDFSGGGYFYLDNQDRAVVADDHPPHLGRGRDERPAGPASRSSATTT